MAYALEEQGLAPDGAVDQATLGRLIEPEEHAMLKTLAAYPQLVAGAAADLAPHRIIFYLMELAGQFHSFYNNHKVLTEDRQLSAARLHLCGALRRVFRNGLHLVGLTAPDSM